MQFFSLPHGGVQRPIQAFRLIRFLSNAFRVSIEGAHDMPKIMGYPLIPLIFGSIFVGYLTKDMIIGPGTLFWQNALFVLPENLAIFDAEFLPQAIKLIPVIFSLSGVFLAILFYGILPLNFVYSIPQLVTLEHFFNKSQLIFTKLRLIGSWHEMPKWHPEF